MNCPLCNTALPVDSNEPIRVCPACGNAFTVKVRPIQGNGFIGEELYPEPREDASSNSEDEREDDKHNE